MAYNINKSNSDPVTIPTGAIDNQFDIPLIGQDAINYGDDLALAFVRLLENFANITAPSFGSARTAGQLWYDTNGSGSLKVYNGADWVALPYSTDVVQKTGDENISGDKTFNGRPAFNGGTTGVDSPFTVDSTFLVTDLNADLLDGQEGSYYAVKTETYGKLTKYIPADQMYTLELGNTATFATTQLTLNNPELRTLDFDQTTEQAVQFNFAFPKEWNEGTVTFQVFWTANSTSTNSVVWALQGVSMGATEEINVAFGTEQTVTSANDAQVNNLNVSSESSAITIAGVPGEDNMCFFRLYRDTSDPGDDLAAAARLIGIKLFYTTDATTSV